MWYPPPMKSGINTKNPKKFYHYHCVHSHDTKECHAIEKKIKILIFIGHLQQFIKNEIQP